MTTPTMEDRFIEAIQTRQRGHGALADRLG
jgi:hypothetical protein